MKTRIPRLFAVIGATGALALSGIGVAAASNGADDAPGTHQEHNNGEAVHHGKGHHHHKKGHHHRHGQGTEAGDDHGVHGTEPGDDNGGHGEVEPGDDHGGPGNEPGDDNGGHGSDD